MLYGNNNSVISSHFSVQGSLHHELKSNLENTKVTHL